MRWSCDQAIRPAMWRCSKILRVLQQHHSSSKPPGGRSKSKAEHPRDLKARKEPQGFGSHCATMTTQRGNHLRGQSAAAVGLVMQDRVDDPPVVRCPGCNQPMEAKGRRPVRGGLVDIRYVCAGCGMETKRPIAGEAH